jgi:protocatechuate 3,4-dioxygenase beta subunit
MSDTSSFAFFTEANSDEVVVERMEACRNPRLKEVMTSVVRHLHALVKEVEPTDAEWMAAIQFLTATGQMSDERRQEFILLSDTLGVSMLVDAINNRKPSGATESTVLGPFHVGGAPVKEMGEDICLDGKGMPLVMSGSVRDANGAPVDGAVLDVWMTNDDGFYDVQQPDVQPEMNLRGVFRTGADGRFWFRSVKPRFYPIPDDGPVGQMLRATGRHPYRPAHIHFIISAEGFRTVTTHVFVRGDDYLETDAVFGVKESLILDFIEHDDPSRANELGVEAPFCTAEMDFVLART